LNLESGEKRGCKLDLSPLKRGPEDGTLRTALNQLRWMAAGSLLLVGGAWAGSIYRSAPAYNGPDPAQLATLAGRLQASSTVEVSALPDTPVVAVPRRVITPVAPPRAAVTPVSVAPRLDVPVLPSAGSAATPAAAPPAPAPPAKPAESPVKSLALMGLTHRDHEDTAWLVDIDNMARETAEVGERAFGFTVKEIGAESVLLSRNGVEYELRLGEKSIPVPASPTVAAADDNGFGDGGGAGSGGFGRRNRGQSAFGGQGRGSFRSQYGGRSGGFSSTGAAPSLGSSGSSSGYSGNRSSRFGGSSGGSFGGNRGGTAFGGNSGGGRSYMGGGGYGSGSNNGSTSLFAAGTSGGSTSNPQTARRRGARLTGDTPALPSPQAIANPQTQRRTGSNSGAAFGQAGTTTNATGRGANGSR